MSAFGGVIRIETACLDQVGRAYNAYLRTIRLMRAMFLSSAIGVFIFPLLITTVFLVFLYFASEPPKVSQTAQSRHFASRRLGA